MCVGELIVLEPKAGAGQPDGGDRECQVLTGPLCPEGAREPGGGTAELGPPQVSAAPADQRLRHLDTEAGGGAAGIRGPCPPSS